MWPAIREFTEPTTGISFLGFLGESFEDADFNIHSTSYLVQSPRYCPIRLQFITGQITWEQYWSHKTWLIELKKSSVFSSEAQIKYISPEELPIHALEILKSDHLQSPVQIKLRNLENFLDRQDFYPEQNPRRRLLYQKFVNDYGRYLDLDAV
jgi:hypothetical protein